MSELSDRVNALANGPKGTPPATIAPTTPVVQPSGGGSLADRVNTLANGSKGTPPPTITGGISGGGAGFWSDLWNQPKADLSHPQSWRDLITHTYAPSASDYSNAAIDDFSMGTGDYAQSKLTGEDPAAIRARTEQSQRALGPMGPIVAGASYIFGPGKILGPAAGLIKGAKTGAKVARGTAEAFGAGALSSEGHDLGSDKSQAERAWDAGVEGAESTAFGLGGHAVGAVTGRAVRPITNWVYQHPGRAGTFSATRAASASGADIGPSIKAFSTTTGQPLTDVYNASQFGRGQGGALGRQAAGLAGKAAAAHFSGNPLAWFATTPSNLAKGAYDYGVGKIRNYKVQNALDSLYDRTTTGPTLNADPSGWADALRRLGIGASTEQQQP